MLIDFSIISEDSLSLIITISNMATFLNYKNKIKQDSAVTKLFLENVF